MKVTFICTVLNEEKTVKELLNSLNKQTVRPNEIIIVDGGSVDTTVNELKTQNTKLKLIVKRGNRSVGRNEAIKNATGDIIAISDAGCVLDKNWVKNITESFRDSKIDVVAGYYKGSSKSTFEKCVIPYFLVMPDRVNHRTFLPATRSMAIRKKVFETVGHFNENLSLNEDFEFAKRLQKNNVHVVFRKDAIVYWQPPSSLSLFFKTISRFAQGDIQAKIVRPKVVLLFARYILGIVFLIYFFFFSSFLILNSLILILVLYILWAILKNYRYVNNVSAILWLPLLQFTADFGVISGTIKGAWDTHQR